MSLSAGAIAHTTTSGQAKIPALTGIRGVAAVWVALLHASAFVMPFLPASAPDWLVGHGYLGVDLFFILSGFVLAMTYGPGLTRNWRPALRRFAIGRLFRILPLHWFCLFVLLTLSSLWPQHYWSPGKLTPATFAACLVLVQAWFTPSSWSMAWNMPTWSLSTEWLAYVFFPFLPLLTLRVKSGTVALLLALLGLLAFCVMLILLGDPSLQHTGRLAAPRCLAEFTVGVLLWRAHELGGLRWLRGEWAFFAGLAAVALAVLAPAFELAAPFGFAALILACASPARIPAAVFGNRPVEFLGEISFSLYLTHTITLAAFEALARTQHWEAAPWAARLALVLGLAAILLIVPVLTWRFIEIPGQALGRRLQRARSASAAGSGATI